MAIQNAVQRVHFASIPPTTLMTGNTTQAVLDAVDLICGVKPDNAPAIRGASAALDWGALMTILLDVSTELRVSSVSRIN